MLRSVFSFELRRLLRSGSTYIFIGIMVAVSYLLALMAGGMWKEVKFNTGGERIHANAPLVIDTFYSFINNYVGLIIIVAIIGNAVLKDFKFNTYSMIFTTPVTRFQYLAGRFLASFTVCVLVLATPAIGFMLGFATPGLNADRLGTFLLSPYLHTYWQTIVTNAFIFGSIFFAVSLISRDIFVIWLSLIVFFVANGVASAVVKELDMKGVAALADPMGSFAKRSITEYWSTWDKNNRMIPLVGMFAWNRLLWIGISVGIWVIGYVMFSFSAAPRRISFRKVREVESGKTSFVPIAFRKELLPKAHLVYTTRAMLGNMWGLVYNECKTLMRNAYFRIIVLFGLLFLLLVSAQMGQIYETATFPVTYEVIEYFGGTFQIFMVILTILFGGELVWRAREFRMSNILDALPVPNWLYYVSKLSALMFMQVILLTIVMVAGILVQLTKGYTHLEIGLYIEYLYFFRLPDLWMLSVMSIFVQTLSKNKFVGYFIVGLFYFWNSSFASLVLKHNLLVFASDPGVYYSAMNGFGHAVWGFIVFKLYWGAFCLALAGLSSLFWSRGTDGLFRQKLANALLPENRRSWVFIVSSLLVFLVCGGFIYYNTNIENEFVTSYQQQEQQVEYEKKLGKFKNIPQPKITDVRLAIDLYPQKRGLHASGTYVLENKTNRPIDSVHVALFRQIHINSMTLSRPARLVFEEKKVDYRIYKLAQPLQPGDTVSLHFDLEMITKGIQHSFTGLETPIYNGTFINNNGFLPGIGYDDNWELSDNADRKKHGLSYRIKSNPIDDTSAWSRNLFTHDADFIRFQATLSTEQGQTAIAPGYLQRDWQQGDRHFFQYKMDSPILNFYSFLSARYEVRRDKWNNTNIEIYYTKGHEYDLDRMVNGIKKSLALYTKVFSPYQHRQVRIIEFPRYSTFAQSFPNTIPFSEGIGFIANVDTSKANVDYPFYVTAHEVAHQWFAHQVTGADVEGSNILSESLAQYGAIQVMEEEYGEERVRKFLKIEMDKYLTARSNESEKEKPWAYADPYQGYIMYQKGGLQMHALAKYLSEDSVNMALKRFIEAYAFKGAPYPTTRQLIQYIRQAAPDSMQYFITDAFEKITLYDNKVDKVKQVGKNNMYQVSLDITAQKIYADSMGRETPAPKVGYVEVGIYKDRKSMPYLHRFLMVPGKNHLEIPLNFKPYKAVVDPRVLLIDKKPDDNEKKFDSED